MRVAFDLDNTLIRCGHGFPLERPRHNRLVRLLGREGLRQGNILVPLRLTPLPAGAFRRYTKSLGKLGGQNKVPLLSNERGVAEGLFPN